MGTINTFTKKNHENICPLSLVLSALPRPFEDFRGIAPRGLWFALLAPRSGAAQGKHGFTTTRFYGKRARHGRVCAVTNRTEPSPDSSVARVKPAGKPVDESQVRPVFPFTAIVGQEEMKLALILNVIDPKIGGVMIMGDRGTGKSTTVRALVDLLPNIEVVSNDPFNSDPYDLELM